MDASAKQARPEPRDRPSRSCPLAALLALVCVACVTDLRAPAPRTQEHFRASPEQVDLDALARMSAAADTEPDDLDTQWAAAIAHVHASLQGHLQLRDEAERLLERAWRLDPEGEQVPAARVLARYLNMRSSVLDLSKLDLQITLYESLVEDDRALDELAADEFHYASFIAAAEALAAYGEGRELAALARLQRLERAMQARTRARPDEIDTFAMAGNFELTFAGVIPIGRQRRLAAGNEYLHAQQRNWERLSPAARDTTIAPNVRSVFALYLAEGWLAAAEDQRAAETYRELIELEGQPDTRVRRQIVALAQHRLAHLDTYSGALELLPPWPAGVSGCVGCHATETALPTDDLFVAPELRVADQAR